MSYQELLEAIALKIGERLGARRAELEELNGWTSAGNSEQARVAQVRVAAVTRQICKMSAALGELAEAAGTR